MNHQGIDRPADESSSSGAIGERRAAWAYACTDEWVDTSTARPVNRRTKGRSAVNFLKRPSNLSANESTNDAVNEGKYNTIQLAARQRNTLTQYVITYSNIK